MPSSGVSLLKAMRLKSKENGRTVATFYSIFPSKAFVTKLAHFTTCCPTSLQYPKVSDDTCRNVYNQSAVIKHWIPQILWLSNWKLNWDTQQACYSFMFCINEIAMIRDACFLTIYFHVPRQYRVLSVVPNFTTCPSDVMLLLTVGSFCLLLLRNQSITRL